MLIFTTHGDFVPERVVTKAFDYGLTTDQIDRIGTNYPNTGYGFELYPGEKNYGVSLTSPEWIRARVREVGDLREVFFKERGWDNHQDVFGFVREQSAPTLWSVLTCQLFGRSRPVAAMVG